MANSVIDVITQGSYDVPKTRYEQLLRREQKYFQYKNEFEKKGKYKILSIIEAEPLTEILNKKEEE